MTSLFPDGSNDGVAAQADSAVIADPSADCSRAAADIDRGSLECVAREELFYRIGMLAMTGQQSDEHVLG